ncbi:MAG: NAD(P)/FAD-dependent oxidoreductase [Candidatus Tyrphobacter sp.]
MPNADVVVVGGGIVGTCTAIELQRRGRAVTVVERDEMGAGTAAGSAGYLAYDDIFPIPSPAVAAGLARMLFDKRGPLVVAPTYLPHLAGWGLRFLLAARPEAVRRAIAALAPLNRLAAHAHDDLAARAGASRYLVRESVFHVCASAKTLEMTAKLIPVLASEGFRAEAIDRDALLAAEPIVSRDVAGAVVFPDSHRCTNPGAYGAALAQHFRANGGVVLLARADAVEPFGNGWIVRAGADDVRAPRVVIAAGAWSGRLLRGLGYSVPLESARGYHLMLAQPGVAPTRTLLFEEDHFCATPMEDGLRLAGTVEFAGLDAPPNFYRSDLLYEIARKYLPQLRRDPATRWMGNRPSLPDSLPAIGELPRHPGIVAAFGHERRGLMQSAITARCVADLLEHEAPPVDLTAFRIGRF